MSAQHTPGRRCDACEGFCLHSAEPRVGAGVEMSLRIGQRVRHRDHLEQRVIGVVRGLSLDSEGVLQAHIVLDAPIVIPAYNADDREVSIWHQHVPALELKPFDECDELLAEMLEALRYAQKFHTDRGGCWADFGAIVNAAIAKATGSAA